MLPAIGAHEQRTPTLNRAPATAPASGPGAVPHDQVELGAGPTAASGSKRATTSPPANAVSAPAPPPTQAQVRPAAAPVAARAPVSLTWELPAPETLSETVNAAMQHVRAASSPDGIWRTPYLAGPFQEVISSLALHHLGVNDPEFLKEERGLYRHMARTQAPDGSLPANPGLPPSAGITRLFRLGVDRVLKDDPDMEPTLRVQLTAARDRADAFLATGKGKSGDSLMLHGIVNLVQEVVDPSGQGYPWLVNPYNLTAVHSLTCGHVGRFVARQLTGVLGGMMAAMGILSEQIVENQQRVPVLRHVRDALVRPNSKLEDLEKAVLKGQDRNGSWLLISMATGLNLMALKARGYELDDPEVAKGVEFIRSHRRPLEDGQVAQWWCNSEVWDSCVAADLMLSDGDRADRPEIRRVIDLALEEQADDGRWAFARGSQKAADTDSTSIVLKFLARAYPTAAPEQQAAIKAGVLKCFDSVMAHQQPDGGFNAWEYSPVSWGSRVPGSMEAMAIDPSTPDVTGRVLAALASVDANGLLDPERHQQFSRGVEKAVGYFQGSQTDNGSWWARWITGYLASPAFALPALRASGVDVNQDWIQDCARFLRQHQNSDGGWGETVAADRDAALAAQGPSTPVQTAFAVVSLLAASPTDQIGDDPQLQRAVEYLEKTRTDEGWSNDRPLYTVGPSLEYYDAPFMTHCMATTALVLYQKCKQMGVSAAFAAMAQPGAKN